MWLWILLSNLAMADVIGCGCGGASADTEETETGAPADTGATTQLQRWGGGASAALSAGVLVAGLRRRRSPRAS